MLVLTRKQQEKIQIGDDIVITVLRTKGKTVRLGIEAPSSIPVLRGELAVRIREENLEMDSSTITDRLQSTDLQETPPTNQQRPLHGADEHWDGDSPQVTHKRVPRSRVATVLPALLGEPTYGTEVESGHGPLRSMLDRRAGAAL